MKNLCPTNDFSCPYEYKGWCILEHPEYECDDFMFYNEEEEEEEDE